MLPACDKDESPPAGFTADGFLGGRLSVLQPAGHARAAIDAVLLAAAVPARDGERVLELGSGSGVAGLCVAYRVPGAAVVGLDIQPDLVALAGRSAERNGLAGRVRFREGDVRALPAELCAGFDHVMLNPPFHAAGTTRPSPVAMKALAHAELAGDLAAWIVAARKALRPRGTVSLIHRADRLGAILGLLDGKVGDIAILPLWPAAGTAAKRILVRGRLGSGGPTRLLAGLVLHEADGRYTDAAAAALSGRALSF